VTDGTRRLAAIMFTDLVGFTKLGQRDEEGALRLRKEHQILLRPFFAAHGGREVKSLGDGFLVEFSSAVGSVRCAIEIQEALTRRNALPTSKEQIQLRVGIHVGDVVDEEGDIVGDAVNVASRVQAFSEPGGICISGSIFEQVRNKVPLPFVKVGSQRLKNVEFPVDLYRVVLSGRPSPPAVPPTDGDSTHRLAVLPFANLSLEPEDEYFADGLTDELISRASQIPSFRVIARTSVVRFKGGSKSMRDVGQELGVSVALEGSVRKSGNRVRIMAQLIDTRTEEPLWSSRYDRAFDDIFAIQDDIAAQITSAISVHVSARRGGAVPVIFVAPPPDTQDMEAYANFLHGKKLLGERGSEEGVRQSLAHFEDALRRDPGFARARVGAAEARLYLSEEGKGDFLEGLRRAREELTVALGQNEALAEAHSVLAGLLIGSDDFAGAEREARRAMELNPSLSDPYRWLAQLAAGEGRMEEAIRLLEAARRLDPADINVAAFLGRAYAYAGRDAEALAHWARTASLVPFRTNSHLAEYYLGLGQTDKAEVALREMERLRPNSVWTEVYRGILAVRRGHPDEARRAIERLEERARNGELTVFFTGFLHFALGDQDAFVACMEAAFELHALPLMDLMYSPLYESARHDPRILDLLRRQSEMRLPTSEG
jgi:adenylate cyclase